jgi:site-specific DNA-methyltransferase (adenine-specific)
MDAKKFETFIVEKFGGKGNVKQVSDKGLDGIKIVDNVKIPIQVKQSETIGRNAVDNFVSACRRFDPNCKTGYIIAFSFGKGIVQEAARLKN